jgi:hypothetical protein
MCAGATQPEGYWQGVQASGVLRCGAAVAPPYVMRHPAIGEHSGLCAELCRELATTLEVKTEFVVTTWATTYHSRGTVHASAGTPPPARSLDPPIQQRLQAMTLRPPTHLSPLGCLYTLTPATGQLC